MRPYQFIHKKHCLLLLYIVLMQHHLHSSVPAPWHLNTALLEREAAIKKLAAILTSIPSLPSVLAAMIVGYAKEWQLKKSFIVHTTSSPLQLCPVTTHNGILYTNAWSTNAYDLEREQEDLIDTYPHSQSPRIAYIPQNKQLVMCSRSSPSVTIHDLSKVTLRQIAQYHDLPQQSISPESPVEKKPFYCAISPAGDKLAVASWRGIIDIFSLPKLRRLQWFNVWKDTPETLFKEIVALSWNYDGTLLALKSQYNPEAYIFNCKKDPTRILSIAAAFGIIALACSPAANHIVMKTSEQFSCFELLSGKLIWSKEISNDSPHVVFSSAGTFVATALSSALQKCGRRTTTVGILDATTGDLLASFADNASAPALTFWDDDIFIASQNPTDQISHPLRVFSLE